MPEALVLFLGCFVSLLAQYIAYFGVSLLVNYVTLKKLL